MLAVGTGALSGTMRACSCFLFLQACIPKKYGALNLCMLLPAPTVLNRHVFY